MLQPPVAGLKDAHQILLLVLMDASILVRRGTEIKGGSKEENTPHRKIDAVIALLCAMKVAEAHVIQS